MPRLFVPEWAEGCAFSKIYSCHLYTYDDFFGNDVSNGVSSLFSHEQQKKLGAGMHEMADSNRQALPQNILALLDFGSLHVSAVQHCSRKRVS